MKPVFDSIPINNINVSDRAREDVGDIDSLKESIERDGLIHPIVVQRQGGKYLLLAGARRLEACRQLGWTVIPAMIHEPTDKLKRKLVELYENLARKSFTWQEEVRLKEQIHRLYVEQYGEKKGPSSEGWSIRDTAKALGESPTTTSKDLNLAKTMHKVPDIAAAKTKVAAYKEMSRVFDHIKAAAVTAIVEKKGSNVNDDLKTRMRKMMDAYVVGDFFENVGNLPDQYFHLAEVDPPYGINLLDKKRSLVRVDEYSEVDASEYPDFVERVVDAIKPKLKPDAWVIWWYAMEPWQEVVFSTLRKYGFKGARMPLVWLKKIGQTRRPELHLARNFEVAYYMRRGKATIVEQGTNSTFEYYKDNDHPAGRPVALMRAILKTFGTPGQRVLVPFAGSGSTLVAAFELGMNPIGFDLSEEYKDIYINLLSKSEILPL